jgi:hypothetical protein
VSATRQVSDSEPTAGLASGPRFPLLAPLRARNFALLWGGNAASLAGDQFQLVALAVLAVLALDLTSSTAMLGAVLGVQAVPRAVLMLVGPRKRRGPRLGRSPVLAETARGPLPGWNYLRISTSARALVGFIACFTRYRAGPLHLHQ